MSVHYDRFEENEVFCGDRKESKTGKLEEVTCHDCLKITQKEITSDLFDEMKCLASQIEDAIPRLRLTKYQLNGLMFLEDLAFKLRNLKLVLSVEDS